jgi:hypothetical protein
MSVATLGAYYDERRQVKFPLSRRKTQNYQWIRTDTLTDGTQSELDYKKYGIKKAHIQNTVENIKP